MPVFDPPDCLGPYRIVRPLDLAGWNRAYVCEDPATRHHVIVRVLDCRAEGWADAKREHVVDVLRRLATLRHPEAMAIQRVEQHEDELRILSDGFEGTPLSAIIAGGQSSVEDTLHIVTRACAVLASARARQMPELEVSPDSVWVGPGLETRVLIGPAVWHLMDVVPGSAAGPPGPVEHHPAYLSPEYVAWRTTDERTEVFEIGSLLYEALTGRKPFGADTPEAIRDNVRTGTFAPLSLDRAAARAAIEPVLKRALAVDPSQRFQTVEAVARALRAAAERLVATRPSVEIASAALPAAEEASRALDENVQFSLFRPKSIVPARWYTLLVFAHLSEARPDAGPDEPDPVAEVQRQAAAILGDLSAHGQQTVDSLDAVPREGELTIVPHCAGIDFNPARRTFRWTESVHREEFRLRASTGLAPGVARGRVSIYLGALVIAEIPLPLRLEADERAQTVDVAREAVRPYRRIFASYSHRDRAIVEEYAEYARAVGDRYLQDVIDLRSGEQWQPALESMIRRADVFQLFWSWNALESAYVTQEWQYAVALGRPAFVRPVYWDEPLPAAKGLPPSVLRGLHFERIHPRVARPPVAPPFAEPTLSIPAPAPPKPPPSVAAAPSVPDESRRGPIPIARHRPPASPPPSVAAGRVSRWRMLTVAAAVLVAAIVGPIVYQSTLPSTAVDDGPRTLPPGSSPPTAGRPAGPGPAATLPDRPRQPPAPARPGGTTLPPAAIPPLETVRPGAVPTSQGEVVLSVRTVAGSRVSAATVQVFAAESQRPIATTTTDAAGIARLRRLRPGSYRVVVSRNGRLVGEMEIQVPAGQQEHQLRIEVPTDAALSR